MIEKYMSIKGYKLKKVSIFLFGEKANSSCIIAKSIHNLKNTKFAF